MGRTEIEWVVSNWIHLAKDGQRWPAVIMTVMNIQAALCAMNFLTM
jgi:hypothetical protein